mgnify:FL=1|tara:strand:- start:1099 stop:1668 length:570 start_codon:yes stop_codon:yes gene_type:complete
MRIIGGQFRGRLLHMSLDKNTRPLKDLARESIFNLLIHSKNISFELDNSSILDLYAGTGSFGLECLSRKARKVCFVENEKNAVFILKKNIEKLKVKNKIKIHNGDATDFIKNKNSHEFKFNLIFCDPPFKDSSIETLIEIIFSKKILKNKGIIILHRNKNTNDSFPSFFEILDEREYGISKIIFGKLTA